MAQSMHSECSLLIHIDQYEIANSGVLHDEDMTYLVVVSDVPSSCSTEHSSHLVPSCVPYMKPGKLMSCRVHDADCIAKQMHMIASQH